jgi:hypothetical protein
MGMALDLGSSFYRNLILLSLNRKCVKPSKPHLTIQIAQSNLPEDAPVESIPILAARFNADSLKQILVTYGDTFNLRFENVVSKILKLKCV